MICCHIAAMRRWEAVVDDPTAEIVATPKHHWPRTDINSIPRWV